MNRVFPGVLLAAAWFILLRFGSSLLFGLTVLVCAVVGLFEFSRMMLPRLNGVSRLFLLLISILPVIFTFFGQLNMLSAGVFIALIFLYLLVCFTWEDPESSIQFLLRATGGIFFISFPLAHFILLRSLTNGHLRMLAVTLVVVASDTAAFYAGSRFGTTKLCHLISPRKTWEGVVAGVLAAMIMGAGSFLFLPPGRSVVVLAVTGGVIAAIGMLGDLAESMLKRGCGVKDSGTILAGHGGILDRADALFLAVPTYYYFLFWGIL